MKGDLLRFDLTIFNFNFVSSEDNGNILANTGQITVPIGNVLVGDAGCDVKHDDGTLTLDVVSITKTSELFLSGSIPDIEFDGATVCVEDEGMDFHAKGGNIFLFELPRQVTFDEGGFTDPTVPDEDKFELGHVLLSLNVELLNI